MTWRLAPSVKAALAEATRRWPNRSKASDGTIGDAAHSSRGSDHNPDENGIVHAYDLTHDPANGVDCAILANHLQRRVLAGEEKRVKYVIWNGRIFNPSVSDNWRTYYGSNPHDKHMHVSVLYTTAAENDVSDWWALARPTSLLSLTTLDDMARYDAIRHVDTGAIALVAPGFFKHVSGEEWTLAKNKGWCGELVSANAREWDLARALAFGGEEPEAERQRD